ncbi:hypothetical protein EOPP23_14695 [Endozoicomonas sp. OPT23]|uniref:hypothetical protein n=1 Tax=Endozoicomonas sp. OPT23 TaxID=2072845 RepID=UPI00129BBE62|nr:hypothetical protein [Endozoicomonas sp. OPT23]MRI34240.1 hypothetical protein [Endozoicomonas sp. OPT23]
MANIDGAKNSRTTTPDRTVESKTTRLTKLKRFLGFSRIQVINLPRSELPRASSFIHTDPTRLKNRNITHEQATASLKHHPETDSSQRSNTGSEKITALSSLRNNYEGFRANRANIKTLLKDLSQGNTWKTEGESNQSYQIRIKLALVLSGIAKQDHHGEPSSRRTTNRPITAHQLNKLSVALNQPIEHLLISAHKHGSIDNVRLLNDPVVCTALGESAGLVPIKSSSDFHDRYQMLRDYFVIGEGSQTHAATGSIEAGNLGRYLPELPERKQLTDFQLVQIDRSRAAGLREDATEVTISPPGIKFDTESKVIVPYQADNKEHRFLALLNELSYTCSSYCQGQTATNLENDNVDAAEDFKRQSSSLDRVVHHASHTMMKKAFPNQITTNHYQQLVLKAKGAEHAQWNSDMTQPRGGWTDTQPIRLG